MTENVVHNGVVVGDITKSHISTYFAKWYGINGKLSEGIGHFPSSSAARLAINTEVKREANGYLVRRR